MSLLSLLWLSPAPFSFPAAVKYIQLKLDLQESQKVDKNDNSKALFCENALIVCFAGDRNQILWWCALIVLVFGERAECPVSHLLRACLIVFRISCVIGAEGH